MAVTIELRGREAAVRLPDMFATASRSVDAAASNFLPADYLVAKNVWEVGPAARDATEGQAALRHEAGDNDVLVLELADGGTLVTSVGKLRETLLRTHPNAVAADGTLLLEKLRADGAAPRGYFDDIAGGLIRRVFSFVVGEQPDDIVRDALKQSGLKEAELGVTWLGTQALMRAIESRLPHGPGLYRWAGGNKLDDQPLTQQELAAKIGTDPAAKPMLVFIHGMGSHTLGAFGDLRAGDRSLWSALEDRFPGGVYGFEHRTLSDSPIDNATQLLSVLPERACVSFVSHSRGGLVADLLCLGDFASLIPGYAHEFDGVGNPDEAETQRIKRDLGDAHKGQRAALDTLLALRVQRAVVVQRYVRVASPAAGTKLASGNFDLFLSALLTLVGQVPFFFGSPFYAALKRVVLEIVKKRTDPHLVPGIEAMLPDSPMARLLQMAPVQAGLQMSVMAGDIEGGGMLKRLGVMLTDFLFFDNTDNDLVVDTPAMLAGIAPKAAARVKFDRGEDVSHFRYFASLDSRTAMRDWLVAVDTASVTAFISLPGPEGCEAALQAAVSASRDVQSASLPVVVVLPGIMGSHLAVRMPSGSGKSADTDRVWFDPLDIAGGGLEKIKWRDGSEPVSSEDLFGMSYGKLCEHLSRSHRVERFHYDWRQPLDVLGERLGQFLESLLRQTDQPVRLLAHSMGGLVVRSCIYRRRTVMDQLMARNGARLVMLGTPNQGAYSMVENLIGKGDTLRMLVRLDLKHDMQQVLDIVAGFRGALQLLPKPGFKDQFQGQSDGGADGVWDFAQESTWAAFSPKVKDLWFGNGRVGKPAQGALNAGSWLWQQDGVSRPALPADYSKNAVYVFGVARNTACGLREDAGRLRMVGTTRGDGTVSWLSGRIDGIGSFYYMPAAHGDLASTSAYFDALQELLTAGSTGGLATQPPAVRAIEQPQPVIYDAGPPGLDDADAVQRKLMGGSLRERVPARPKGRLTVEVRAMDLRFITAPILVGHYEHDPISGPEALIDRELLDGELSQRYNLGMYPGALGTASAVLRVPNAIERKRGRLVGAVVTGLGSYDKALTPDALTEAVRAAALRYLLQAVDMLGEDVPPESELPLAALLLGFNSSANLTVGASVEALVRGVMEANARFQEATGKRIRIGRLTIVELYLDTAISAVYALRSLGKSLSDVALRLGTQLACEGELMRGEGVRQRLFDRSFGSYWPRLMITDAGGDGAAASQAPPKPGEPRTQIGSRLRYLYVGERARAESVVQQRQPGVVEQIVRRQIASTQWQEDFGRMLFQLMVPTDFKDAARQLSRVVLVVDGYTANMPWELMYAGDPQGRDSDKRPLALRTAVVRQLASSNFRRQVRQALGPNALVIGNPGLDNFLKFFPGPAERPFLEPPKLGGAETEATAIAGLLKHCGYSVLPVIGEDKSANDVLAALYQRPWRIVHISAHGVFDLPHIDGGTRSGVLLSDGVLITAAEIDGMEVVPDLVFLNCCNLGKVESAYALDGNKLAASLARELIQIGVRCVVVAGWAVNDEIAQHFGEAFYDALLLRDMPFGDAVLAARKAAWNENPADITWGAFQAYGDPGWRANPRAEGHSSANDMLFASPDELLDELVRRRVEFSRRSDRQTERDKRDLVDALNTLLKTRCPPNWQTRPEVLAALGAAWRDLGEFERARDGFSAALRAQQDDGAVPVRDIEQLANVEARLGQQLGQMELIDHALQRLKLLNELVGGVTVERGSLCGSAYKRKADLIAGGLIAGTLGGQTPQAMHDALREALTRSAQAYADVEGRPDTGLEAYPALNHLALQALVGAADAASRAPLIDLARHCGAVAAEKFKLRSSDPWTAVMQPEAVLVEALLDDSFGVEGEIAAAALTRVEAGYRQMLAEVTIKPSQLDSVFAQPVLLSRFADALSLDASLGDRAPALRRVADRLLELVQRLRPGQPARSDRPPSASRLAPKPAPKPALKPAPKPALKPPPKPAPKPTPTANSRSVSRKAKPPAKQRRKP